MAASNYYGFPHPSVASPYSTPPITAYCTPATTYAVQQVPGAGHAATPAYGPVVQAIRPITSVNYGAYPTHTADYGYETRQPEPPPQTVATASYQDTYSYGRATAATNYESKPYYQPVVTQAVHTATDSYYQTGSKGGYSQSSSVYTQPQRQVTPIKTMQTVNSTASSYVVYPVVTTVQQSVPTSTISPYTPVSTYNSTPASYSGTSYTSYDPTVYSASGTYYQPQEQQPPQQQPPQQPPLQLPTSQQQPQKSSGPTSWNNAVNRAETNPNKKTPYQNKQLKQKGPPKQPQIHYCDICKISCAGPQTYREHLEGQKHKKKEAVLKSGSPTTSGPRGVPTQLRCELCDVSCTGADAYAAHIRGAKHQKVVKLHTKLGKPIPLIESVTMDSMPNSSTMPTATTTITMPSKLASSTASSTPKSAVLTVNNASSTAKHVQLMKPAATKIPFVGSNKPQPVPGKPEPLVAKKEKVTAEVSKPEFQNDNFTQDDFGDNLVGPAPSLNPIGDEFVEEICNDDGKIIRFHCKLCECSFNDPNAKDMHLKGRRHRLQFKKKVNPQFPVEIKPSNRARKLQEEKMKKLKQKDLIRRHRDDEQRFHLEKRRYEQGMYWRRVEEKLYWEEQRRLRAPDWHPPPLMGRPGLPVPPLLVGNNFNIRGFERRDRKMPRIPRLFGLPPQFNSAHPNRRSDYFEDQYIMFKHSSIYPTEEELLAIQKLVSHSERSLKLVSDSLTEQNTDEKEKDDIKEKWTKDLPNRCLKGVMRVGVLAKGLLLRGDRNVKLVLLSDKKPTTSLLQKVAELLPKQLLDLTQDQYEVSLNLKESNITIASFKEPKMQAIISIASPMRDEKMDKEEEKQSQLDPPDLISIQKCMDSLAALRHAKWFQARANGLPSCVIVIRILRDLCHRVPTWSPFPDWAMELLVERSLSSVPGPLSPGDALRRVLECIASGTLLPDSIGLPDPCEKDQTDVFNSMTNQQREDITASAQHALRLMAFRQIYKILGIEPFPPSKRKAVFYNRKRRRDTTEVDDKGDEKKDKKDDTQEA